MHLSDLFNTFHKADIMSEQVNQCRAEREDEGLYVSRHGVDLNIVLSRPRKGDVLTARLAQVLTEIYKQAANAKEIFRILLTAEGRHTCAGMDPAAEGGVLDEDQEAKQRQWHFLQGLFETIDHSPKVTLLWSTVRYLE